MYGYDKDQLKRDLSHMLQPQLVDCIFYYWGSRQWCKTHGRVRGVCEAIAIENGRWSKRL